MGLYHDKAYKKEVVPGQGTIVVGEKPPETSPGSWTKCADEGGVCSCTGQARFGTDPNWTTKTSTTSLNCELAKFLTVPGDDGLVVDSNVNTTPAGRCCDNKWAMDNNGDACVPKNSSNCN